MSLPKVLHIINGLDAGGAETLLLEICKHLHGTELDIHVCALKGGALEEKFRENKIPLTVFNQKKYSITRLLNLKRLIEKFNPSIVHTHLFHAGLLTRLVVSKKKIKLISTEHNTTDLIERNFFARFLNNLTFKKNDLCIAVSKSVKNIILKKTKINPTKVKVVYPGINLDRFVSSSSRSLTIKDTTGPVVGTISRLSHEKGIDILLRAFERVQQVIPKATLHILGIGKEKEHLEELAEQLKIKGKIIWHGYQKDILPFLKNFDCYIQPSRHESFGITVLEAMACRIPVIASRIDGLSEIIQDGYNGLLVTPEDDKELSSIILKLLKEKSQIETLTAAAFNELKKYRITDVINQYIKIYRQVL